MHASIKEHIFCLMCLNVLIDYAHISLEIKDIMLDKAAATKSVADVVSALTATYTSRNNRAELAMLTHVHRCLVACKPSSRLLPCELQEVLTTLRVEDFMQTQEANEFFIAYLLHSRFDMSVNVKNENEKVLVNKLQDEVLTAIKSTLIFEESKNISDIIEKILIPSW